MKNVTFVIPAYNEEKNIGTLLNEIQELYPNSPIIVINNNSTDNTCEIAEKFGVLILSERKQGKGNAIKTGFKAVKTEYAVMLDADNTYSPNEAKQLVEPLIKNKCDVVMGSRLNKNKENGAITRLNIIGNHILSLVASILYLRISDVCTGYWAFKKEVIDFLLEKGISSSGFELEAEMFIKVSKGNFRVKEIPIEYKKRSDIAKLNSVKDGWQIFRTLLVFRFVSNDQKNEEIIQDSDSAPRPPYMFSFLLLVIYMGYLIDLIF